MQQPSPPDRWCHLESDDCQGYLKNIPLEVGTSADRDVEVSKEGPDVVVWTPAATFGWFALLGLGAMVTLMGIAGWIGVLMDKMPFSQNDKAMGILGILFATVLGISMLAGGIYWWLAQVTFLFNRATGLMTARSRFRTLEVPLTSIESIEFMLGKTMKGGGGYQVNLVFHGMRPRRPATFERKQQVRRRRNLSACSDEDYLRRHAEALADFLNVPFVDVSDRADVKQAAERLLGHFLPTWSTESNTREPS